MPIESGGAASLPLPNGASTLAEQQTQSTTISNIDTNTDGVEAALALILARLSTGSSGPTTLAPKTVPTGTAEAVHADAAATRYVRVTSDFANKKTVYVGGTGVTVANGQPLRVGDVYTAEVNNANLVFCICADAAQILRVEVL